MENNPTQTPTAPVMDIQPPQPPTDTGPVTPPTAPEPEQAPAPTPVAATETAPAPAPEVNAPVSPLIANTPTEHHGHKAPIGAIVTAVVIAVTLAVVSVFAYMKTQEKDSKTPAATTSDQVAPVTAGDVDKTSQELDDNLKKVDESKDFGDTNLSDSTLAL